MNKFEHGIFLARMQPLHLGHMYMIEKALCECVTVTIVLGSSNKYFMSRNPFTLDIRKRWIEGALKESKDIERINIFCLPDWSLENDTNETIEWGRYLYYNIVSRIQAKHFTIFYSDKIDIINSWFDETLRERVYIRHVDRSNVYEGLSATKIREAFINGDKTYLEKYLPKSVLEDYSLILSNLLILKETSLKDFSMK